MTENEQQDEGQVSEVSGLKKEGEPSAVSDGDSVAGQPTQESGSTDEGPQGPDAPTFSEDQSRYPDKDDVETTG
ncbi:hypothetical protein [Nocardioides pyridinolyticus]